jgi:hypothetical protein
MADRVNHPISSTDEPHERDLNRHRGAEQRDAKMEELGRLHTRGINIDSNAPAEAVVEVLEAVELFERAVAARGGDLMVDTPPVREPDNPSFVLPRLGEDESLADFARRIRTAAAQLAPRAD